MKRVLLAAILIVGITAAYGYAQMGQGHMPGEGHMGQGMMGGPGYGETKDFKTNQYQKMGQGMMGYGMGFGECGMMGQGNMGGYGMMGRGHMGGMMGGGHMGGMMGPGMMGGGHMGSAGYGASEASPEAYKKYQEEYQKYMDDTTGLRKKLHNKKFDYFEAARNSKTTRGELLKIEKEIRDLQWEMYEKAPR